MKIIDGFRLRDVMGQATVIGEGVGGLCYDVARETCFAVGAHLYEYNLIVADLLHIVHLVLPTQRSGLDGATAVQAVAEVVLGEVILHFVDSDFAVFDTIGVTTY